MKTIEEKAKAYDEALKQAKKELATCGSLNCDAARQIFRFFPELRESEDERMIREFNDWLCEEIECRTNDLRDEKDRRTLNMLCYVMTKVKEWLKKQKESLHISETCKENADSFTDDERIRKGLIEALTVSESIGELKFRFPEQTRQECIAYLERQKEHTEGDFARGYDCGYEACLNSHGAEWFEKQKEWSEEDERVYQIILNEYRQMYEHRSTSLSRDDIVSGYNFLKSLRPCPSWKPSEEQMKRLADAVESWRGGIGYNELKSLYNDLLKLK